MYFGWVTLILVVGAAVFPFWGWTSTGWVLGIATLWSVGPPLVERLTNDGPPPGHFWHGDDPPLD